MAEHGGQQTSGCQSRDPVDPLWQLAGQLGKEWKPIGRNLGYSEPAIQTLEMDHTSSAHERAYQMLLRWINKTDPFARRDLLEEAVTKAERLDLRPLVSKVTSE